jgi:hypothetical protein
MTANEFGEKFVLEFEGICQCRFGRTKRLAQTLLFIILPKNQKQQH